MVWLTLRASKASPALSLMHADAHEISSSPAIPAPSSSANDSAKEMTNESEDMRKETLTSSQQAMLARLLVRDGMVFFCILSRLIWCVCEEGWEQERLGACLGLWP